MKLTLFPGCDLPAELRVRWSELQQADPALVSPYFRPEFTEAIAHARDDVSVAVVEDGAAFFPFQRGPFKIGVPVGGPLSDYHGCIAKIGFEIDPRELLRKCGLRAWDFDHLPAAQTAFTPWKKIETESPIVDLSQPENVGSGKLRQQTANRRRKLSREVGEVTFEMHSEDSAVFEQLLAWKSAQYRSTGEVDIFTLPWIRTAMDSIRSQKGANFCGSLSVLRVGGKPVAAHFGMRSGSLLHYWFPAYDETMSAYSPGTMLLLEVIDAAGSQGIRTLDLGKGNSFYKGRIANGAVPLWEGSVISAAWLGAARQSRLAIEGWIRRGPLIGLARKAGGWIRRVEKARRFR